MRLHRVAVRDWKRFRGGPFGLVFHPRSTLLTGPNEAGKTSLFEALRRVLFDEARTECRWVESVEPQGLTGAEPAVGLEFEHAGRAVRVGKTFGKKGRTELHVAGEAGWRLEARGKEAEASLRALLGSDTASTRSDGCLARDWGAFQWLFVPQEARRLPEAEDGAVTHVGLSSAGVTPDFDAVLDRVARLHAEFFTPSGERSRSRKSPLWAVEKEIERLEASAEPLREEIRAVEMMRREFEEIREGLPALEQDAARAEEAREAVEAEAVDLSAERERLKGAEAEAGRLCAEADRARAVLAERAEREGEAARARKAAREAAEKRAGEKALLAQVKERLDRVREAVRKRRGERDRLRRAHQDAAIRVSLREGRARVAAAREALETLREMDREMHKARGALQGEAPGEEDVARAEALENEIRVHRAQLARAALAVERSGEGALDVRLDGRPLEGRQGVALERVEVRGPGGEVVRIQSGAGEARRLAEEAERKAADLSALLAAFGADDATDLRARWRERFEVEKGVETLLARRRAADARSTEAVAEAKAAAEASLEALEKKAASRALDPEAAEGPEDALASRLEALEDRLRLAEEELGKAESEREQLEEAVAAAEEASLAVERAVVETEVEERKAVEEIQRHLGIHGPTERCREALASLAGKAEEASARAATTREDVARREGDAEAERQKAVSRARTLRDLLSARRAKAAQLEEALAERALRGAYTRLAEVERTLLSERARQARLERRARGLRILKGALEEVRSSAVARVTAPIKDRLDALLGEALRGRYTSATLSDALLPTRLEGLSPCPFALGSQGLRELVASLVRLSVAIHLAEKEPQVLLLDDPAVHVSRERCERLVDILNRVTEPGRIQAVVLTHRAPAFAGLAGEAVDVETLEPDPGLEDLLPR